MRGSWARSMGLAIAMTTALTACGADPQSDIDPAAVATTYADLVAAAYQASIDSAATMQVAIEAFLSDPTDENLAAAKTAWVAAGTTTRLPRLSASTTVQSTIRMMGPKARSTPGRSTRHISTM